MFNNQGKSFIFRNVLYRGIWYVLFGSPANPGDHPGMEGAQT